MASWQGNRTVEIYRSRRDAQAMCNRLNREAASDGGPMYRPRVYGDGRRGWYVIEVRDEEGRVLGDL